MNAGISPSEYAPPPFSSGLLGRPTPVEMVNPVCYDPDARQYIRGVELADRQPLELGVKVAINNFVIGCKVDQTWPSMRTCALLMGPRTLSGALVPLVGPAMTNENFAAADYSTRKNGLTGNGANKAINTNYAGNLLPRNDIHAAVYCTNTPTSFAAYYASGGQTAGSIALGSPSGGNTQGIRARFTSNDNITPVSVTGFMGVSRNNATNYIARIGGVDILRAIASDGVSTANFTIFRAASYSNARISFACAGLCLNLALLERRVLTLAREIAAAIPYAS